jgi:hypothetical protein
MAEHDAVARALAIVKPMADETDAHTVMRGLERKDGKLTGRECVVVLVEEKKPLDELQFALPHAVNADGEVVRVDVQEAAPFKILLLSSLSAAYSAQAVRDHQTCFSPVVPGGVQIAPVGADWVGTLGCPWTWQREGKDFYGFITNRHVAGLEHRPGHAVGQPHGNTRPVGKLVSVHPFNTVDANQLDLALFDSFVDGAHHVKPEVFGLTGLRSGVADLKLGDRVTKSGRTTGVTTGAVTGLDAQTTVNYGARGNLKFTGQVVIDGDAGDLSQPGDSGSGVFRVSDGLLGALLFAGGGGKTLANPAALVVDAIGGGPFIE